MHTDVTTKYLGLALRSPVIVGACPLTLKPESVRELAIAGAGAVVLPSLMQEQLHPDTHGDEKQRVENVALASQENHYNTGLGAYLKSIPLVKQQSGIPVIASVNGCADGPWLTVVRELEEAGADAIELSIHANNSDPALTADQVEQPLLAAVQRVTDLVSIPVAIKLLPFYTSLPNLAWRLAEMGASGVVLFGREPVWQIAEGDLVPSTHWQLSGSSQLQITLSGLIRLRCGGPGFSIAASGGIANTMDVVQAITAGADVAMVTSEVYRTGPDAVAHLIDGLTSYLQRHGWASYEEFVSHCKHHGASPNRRTQIEPMLGPPEQPEELSNASQQTGDRWGHQT